MNCLLPSELPGLRGFGLRLSYPRTAFVIDKTSSLLLTSLTGQLDAEDPLLRVEGEVMTLETRPTFSLNKSSPLGTLGKVQ